jgi:Phosphoinositide 3-kinase family, accessory domain (PIK domain)/Phosphatidylinositol 3- and 4-kinase
MATAEESWVNVTWMPHASLAQTSHVSFLVRSSHAALSKSLDRTPREWKIRTSVYGAGGIPLVAVSSTTPSQHVLLRQRPVGSTRTDKPQKSASKQAVWKLPSVSGASHDCTFNHLVHVPLRWRDLPRDAYLLFQVIDHTGKLLSSANMPFFTKHGRLSTGLILLDLEPEPEPNGPIHATNNGLLVSSSHQVEDTVWKASTMLDKLESLESSKTGSLASTAVDNRKVFGRVQSTSWLDTITKEYCRNVIASATTNTATYDSLVDETSWKLIVEFPVFEVPVMHEESFYPASQQSASGAVSPLDLSLYRKSAAAHEKMTFHPLQLVNFVDYENEYDNPVEDKYRTLAHDLLRGLVDPALKPDREQRDRLASIIASPSHHPSREEKDLLWRFRFSLVDNQRALTKFLLAVDWTVESEVVQAAELLEQWRRLDIPDALKLLGKHVAFQTSLVRTYAIDTLATAPDVELRLYLLQLVQALKYEAPTSRLGNNNAENTSASNNKVSSLASFLIGRAAGNLQLANYLYWYLKVELKDPTYGARYQEVFLALKARLSETHFRATGAYASHSGLETQGSPVSSADSKSSAFKAIVSSVSSTVSSKLGSSLRGSDHSTSSERSKKHTQGRSYWDILVEQDEFISGLMDIQMKCRDVRGKKDAKESQLQSLLSSEGYDRNPHRDPVPLPSAPHVFVNGVKPDTAKMFKSALYPALVDFHVETTLPMIGEVDLGGHGNTPSSISSSAARGSPSNFDGLNHLSHFKLIVKTGDDLRQDQLVIMLVQLMDGLLKRAALNLCLTPYSIIAMSPTSGLVEFVDGSMPISQVLSQYNGSILQYFQAIAPQKGSKYDVRQEVISTYVRSCAGYCVITYLLAVGDRHLDNILMDKSGHFFHIDFGFIFGRDPKPLPPAFRLTREVRFECEFMDLCQLGLFSHGMPLFWNGP